MVLKGFDAAIANNAETANAGVADKMLIDCRGDCQGKTAELNPNDAFWHQKSLSTSPFGMLDIPKFKVGMAEALNDIYKGEPISVAVKLADGNMDVKAFRGSVDNLVFSRKVPLLQTHD
jgi:hypothetical protein